MFAYADVVTETSAKCFSRFFFVVSVIDVINVEMKI